MWIKKTVEELQEDQLQEAKNSTKTRRNISLKAAGIVMLFLLAYRIYYYLVGYDRYTNSVEDFTFSEILEMLPVDMLWLLILSLVVFVVVVSGPYKYFLPKVKTEMCEDCHTTKTITEERNQCQCGGQFYPLNYYRWEEDKS